tara:strand:- start:431 stop:796 length:366 start_codon:yes stop_codon:yes gene_type:complete
MTENFSIAEFQCKCGCKMPLEVTANIEELVEELQFLRNIVDSSITINSAYRCPDHNKSVGGAKNSQHLLGKASDIVVQGKKPSDTYKLIEDLIKNGVMEEGGLGSYNTFTHYDIRGTKARW